MGKSKKIRKGTADESESDVENDTQEVIEKAQNKKKSSKPQILSDDTKLDKADSKKSKSKKEKKPVESDGSDIEVVSTVKKSFALLQIDDEDSDGDSKAIVDEDEDECDTKPIKKDNKKKSSDDNRTTKNQGGKKGKKNRKRDDSDEDIEKVLAELEMEYAGIKKEPEPSTEEKPKEEKKKKEKLEEKKEPEVDTKTEEASTVKTAAQKKKEKKEREKQKKLSQKKQDTTKEDSQEPEEQPKEMIKKLEDAGDKQEEDDQEGEKKSKKKKKKGKDDEDKDAKDGKKGPGKKTIAAMQEALKKLKEEEERLKKEEEERLKREEEAEKARLEALRLEQERKERKKQKEKERKERLKAEGKLLTAKQKADRVRAQALIDSLKAQGVELPDVGEKKPRLGTRIRPNKQKKEQTPVPKEEDQTLEPEKIESPKEEAAPQPPEEIKEPEVEEDVKDAWDASSDDEEKEESQQTANKSVESKEQPVEAEAEESSSEEDEESDSDEEEEESESESEDEEEDGKTVAERVRDKALERIKIRKENAEKNKSPENLRAAIVCVLGHVDTGKTKILDKLRRTNVQDGEAGGITQQIGATNVPMDAIKEQIKIVKGFNDMELKIPGLLIIDTPGHESFSNLRNRGSSLCDIAILVVDIMHGLEPQTIESINILKNKKTPFLVALNKIDRLYDWRTMNRKDVRDILKAQAPNTQLEFETRTKDVVLQFAEQGLNAALFYENPDTRTYVSLVPTSAITGEGMGNLLALIVDYCQTRLTKRLMYSDELQATVLEVKAIPGLGTTIDVILVNGTLREGDTMLCAGTDGPIETQIRSLLMPQPLRELRVKNAYIEYKEIKAAQGVKIAAKELEKAIAGLNLYVAQKSDEIDILKEEVARELKSALSNIKLADRGVYVQASTLGSLEALLEFLRTSKIPYSGIRIGPVVKKDVMKASIMLEHESQYATILAFDVKVERDAQELADSVGVKIFQADIIYHLFDKFMAYREELKQRKREEFKHIAVFPCKLKILPQFVFNSRDPIVAGVMVEAGIVREGTPICVPSKEFVDLGIVTSIESNHKTVESARKGMEVCIKIEPVPGESPKMFGRHFDETDFLVSKISRQSIDACKDYFRDDLQKTDWQLMVELKKLFQIL
ncbi:eukaryotic translation initiation factor 5B [Diorhabda carinulata]|uniref:eukaryotic translation initiation factor 5B n=1 Tax=Diorhabda carinulata TaxID=1163345 RepID=UPI0025A30F1B|nr:eukaryotic translation initiation factor 5B [Diorhabda carinulata]